MPNMSQEQVEALKARAAAIKAGTPLKPIDTMEVRRSVYRKLFPPKTDTPTTKP